MEQLELRRLLVSDWQNPLLNVDVNDDGRVSALDALLVINLLNQRDSSSAFDFTQPVGNNPYFDTNGNGSPSAFDALLVINYLNQRDSSLSIDLSLQSDTGNSSSDFITNDSRIAGVVTTNAGAGPTVKARINRGPIVDVAIGNDGKFSFAPTELEGLSEGSLNVKFLSDDLTVKKLARLQFTLDTTPPALSDPQLMSTDDSGVRNDDNVTKVVQPRIVVNGERGARVKLKVDDSVVFDGQLSESIIPLSQSLSDGVRQLSAVATDIAGNVTASRLVPFVIDTIAPQVTEVDLAPSSDSGILGDRSTDYSRVTLSGMTEGNSFIVAGSNAVTVRSAGDGSFRIPQFPLNPGLNSVFLTVTDLAGNTNSGQAEITRSTTTVSADPVLQWNQAVLTAIQRDATTPPVATRGMAMMSIAMLDVIAAIEKTPSFLVSVSAPAEISTEAAVSTAAYEVLKYLYPAQEAFLESTQSSILTPIANNVLKSNGQSFGKLVADAVIAIRRRDGWDRYVGYFPNNGSGQWQQTAPMFDIALLPQWGDVQPFAVTDIAGIIPAGPPSLSSEQWSTAFNEVKSLGAAIGATRTPEQTEIARFWADGSGTYTPPGHWNAIARQISSAQGLSLGENARLFASLNIALSDSSVASWKTKYDYEFWRPITAVREADTDGNSTTTADTSWSSFLITPPHPEYVSGHSTYSGAAARVLADYFGDNQSFSTTSLGLPGVTRSFTSFTQAAAEAGRSRIYGGIHYEFSNQDGQALGRAVADQVLERFSVADDLLAPSILLLSPTSGMVSSTNPTIEGWVLDNLSGVASASVQIDNGTAASLTLDANGRFSFTPSMSLDGTQDGLHTLRFNAIDKAGLQSSFEFTFTLDTLVPTASITSPADGVTITAGQLLEGSVSGTGSNLVSLTYQIDNGARIPISFTSSGGSFSQILDLSKISIGSHTLKITARDAAGLETTINRSFTTSQLIPLAITRHTPSAGSNDIGSTFRPQVYFSRPVNVSTLTAQSFYATDTTGTKLPATIVPAQDGTFAWLFFTNPMPGASTITVHVDGDLITGLDGNLLDAAGSGTAGGKFTYSFTTVSLSLLPNTSIKGRVVDPGIDLKPMTRDDILAGPDGILHTSDDVFMNPIVGAKVFILGRESQLVMTDANGFFELTSVPSGTIKLAIDGRTATNAPSGVFWPEMVMDLELVVGSVNTVMGTMGTREERDANLDRTEVYLPRLENSILKPISNTATTTVGVDIKSSPNLTNEQRSNLKLEVVPNSILGDNGQPLANAQIGISTVPPELVRDMLPPGLLQHTFDITIQSPGAATFNTPLQMTFPNVFNAAPGTQLNFLSFDHTTGRLVIEGTATVSADGLSATTDADSGITKPGWHGVTPPGGPGGPPPPPPPPCPNDPPKPPNEIAPVPFVEGLKDFYFSANATQFTLKIGNKAKKPDPPSGSCSSQEDKVIPLVVKITVEEPGSEFLEGISTHTLQFGAEEQTSIVVSMKEIIKKIARDRLYGAKIRIEGYKQGTQQNLLIDQSMNTYRFFEAVDSISHDSVLSIPDTVVDTKLTSYAATIAEVRSRFDDYAVITGATIITHGYQPQIFGNGDSLLPLARAIHKYAATPLRSGWVLDYDVDAQGDQGYFDTSEFRLPETSFEVGTKESGELVLLFDWASESNETSRGWGDAAADALFSIIVGLGLIDPVTRESVPLHFIGHSFGTAVTSQAVRRVASLGINVDHVTYLDPHDFDQHINELGSNVGIDTEQRLYELGFPTGDGKTGYGASVWSNVSFTDVYYQTRGTGVIPPYDSNSVPFGRPIPGAYNFYLDHQHELPLHPTYILGESDHSYVWSEFYRSTIPGEFFSESSMQPRDFDEFDSEGYRYSRVARLKGNGVPRPVPTFFNSENGERSQDHFWSSDRIVDRTTGRPHNSQDRDFYTNVNYPPIWNQYILANGDFSKNPFNVVSDIIPGWSHHGGGGSGNARASGSSGYVELSSGDTSRTHNWFYVPTDASELIFDLTRIDTSDDDLFQVKIDDTAFGEPIPINSLGSSRPSVFIPETMRGSVHTVTFEIVSPHNGLEGVDSVVQIDNVALGTKGVAPVDVDVQFKRKIDFVLGNAPKPSIALSNIGTDFTLESGDTIFFNPGKNSKIGVAQTGTLDIGNGNLLLKVTGTPIEQRKPKIGDHVGRILAVYSADQPGNLSSEFNVGTAGTKNKKEFVLQNLGDQDLIINRIGPFDETYFESSLSDVVAFVLSPNQKLPFTVEYLGGSNELDSIKIEINTGGGTGKYGETKIYSTKFWVDGKTSQIEGESLGKSIVSGIPVDYGNDYVMLRSASNPNTPAIRLRSDPIGNFEAFLPSSEPVYLTIFDPVSGLISQEYRRTEPSGQRTQFLTPYFEKSTAIDSDGDGLPDDIEEALGTSILRSDSNGDGISDFASIQQGLDPLAGKPVVTGIVASLQLQGEAKQIVVQSDINNVEKQTAYIATGSYGLAIVDVSQFNKPTLLGQIDLPGDAVDVAFDASFGIAVVASRTGGVHFVDVSNPNQPILLQTVNANANGVKTLDGFAYVAIGRELRSYDILTGEIIQNVTFDEAIAGLAIEGTNLFIVGADAVLRSLEVRSGLFSQKDTLLLPIGQMNVGGGKLFVGGGVAYIPFGSGGFSGFATANTSNPTSLSLLSGVDGNDIASEAIAANGSGLAVSVGSLGGINNASLLNVSDPTVTNEFVTSFSLPSEPQSVVIAGGLALIANGSSGLMVVSYLSFDSSGNPPEVRISLEEPSIDFMPQEEGIQVLEGAAIPIEIETADDVQVRSVELIVNNQVVSSTLSFPFDLSAISPLLPAESTSQQFTIQARATDTGGNSILSNSLTIQVRPDNFLPVVEHFESNLKDIDPSMLGIQVLGGTSIRTRFTISDLGGLKSVELLLNGVVANSQTRRSGFFAFSTPQLNANEESRDIAIQVRATDRAGNETLSQTRLFTIVRDSSAPKVARINLQDNDSKPLGDFWLNIEFDEPMDSSTLVPSNFPLTDPFGSTRLAYEVQRIGDKAASVRFQLTDPGVYSLSIDAAKIKDLVGTPLGSSPEILRFNASNQDAAIFPHGSIGRGTIGEPASSIISGDLNSDGETDLILVGAEQESGDERDVSIFLGDNLGAFTFRTSLRIFTRSVALGDVNGDGKLDLISANSRSDDASVFLGNGDGTFAHQTKFAVGTNPRSVVTGDVNGDGKLDLITANQSSDDVSVLLGNGDGTFVTRRNFVVGLDPSSVITGDFDGDGHLDLITSNFRSDGLSVLKGNGDGSFGTHAFFGIGANSGALVSTGDVNADGKLDLITSGKVILGNGDGTLAVSSVIVSGIIAVGDVNVDGKLDLIRSCGSVMLGNGDGNFTSRSVVCGSNVLPGVVIDVNGDGKPDLLETRISSGDVIVGLGNGDGTFRRPIFDSLTSDTMPTTLIARDVNSDNKLDLITNSLASNDISVLLGNGNGTFGRQIKLGLGVHSNAMVTGDVNGDGKLDLMAALFSSQDVSVLLGNGDGTFGAQTRYGVGGRPISLVTGDLNGDGTLDLITANSTSQDVSVLLGNGDGTFGSQTNYGIGGTPNSLVTGDVNADGKLDLITNGKVMLGNGDGTFQVSGIAISGIFATGDLNGDSKLDLITANSTSQDVSVLLGNGDGTFGAQTKYGVGGSPKSVVAGDVNGDGNLDLITANGNLSFSLMFGTGDGGFSSRHMFFSNSSSASYALAVGDVDGDNLLDIVTAYFGSGLSVFINQAVPIRHALHSTNDPMDNRDQLTVINASQTQFVIEAAMQWWTSLGVSADRLSHSKLWIADLPYNQLGYALGNSIYIDDNAAGWVWFVDATPYTNEEYQPRGDAEWIADTGEASMHVDLLTVLAHELGHILGLEDDFWDDGSLMTYKLGPGIRRLPTAQDVDRVFAEMNASE